MKTDLTDVYVHVHVYVDGVAVNGTGSSAIVSTTNPRTACRPRKREPERARKRPFICILQPATRIAPHTVHAGQVIPHACHSLRSARRPARGFVRPCARSRSD